MLDNNNIFINLIKWIRNLPHESQPYLLPVWYEKDFSKVAPLRAIILKRRDHSLNVPYLVFVLLFKQTYIQTIIPFEPLYCSFEKREGKMSAYPIYMDYFKNFDPAYYDFSSANLIIREEEGLNITSLEEFYSISWSKSDAEEKNKFDLLPKDKQKEYLKKHGITYSPNKLL